MRKVRRAGAALSILFALLTLSFSSFAALAEEPPAEDPLEGKSVLFVGDSICEALCEWSNGRWPYGKDIVGWAGRIIYGHNMTGKNLGRSGASLSNCRGANTVISQLAQEKNNVYDYVIMHGGANDAWDSAPVGEMTEGFEGPFDLTTFAGGLEDMFRYAKEAFPSAQLGFIINFRLPKGTYGRLSDMSEYMDLAIRICEKWEIPYLDLYHDDAFNEELKVTTNTYLHDYIHPNGEGYDVIAPHVDAWLQTVADGSYVYPSQDPSGEESGSEEGSEPGEGTESDEGTGSDATSGTEDSAKDPSAGDSGTSGDTDSDGSGNLLLIVVIIACVVVVGAVAAFLILHSRKAK